MNRFLGAALVCFVFVSGVLFGSGTLHAQNTAPDRQLFMLEIEYANRIMAGDVKKISDMWHQDFFAWPAGEYTPWDKAYAVKAVKKRVAAREGKWHTPMVEPMGSMASGDVGVTHINLEFTVERADGEKTQAHRRISHFWVKTGKGWKIIGGTSSIPSE